MDSTQFARPLPGSACHVTDGFAARLRELARTQVIPYQWEALHDRVPGAEPSGCIHNFRAACGEEQGEHYGYVFQDSDLYKWMEAASFSLAWAPDPDLEKKLDSVIDLISRAQLPDGYLNTYYQLTDLSKRWTNLKDHHELYCAGHLMEAAVAHFRSTGKTTLLAVAEKLAAHIASVLGPGEGKLHGYPGHEEVELGLVKLYEVTGRQDYLDLARYFLSQRGREPNYFREETERQGNGFYWQGGVYEYAYYQAHKPLLEQDAPIGHAVRAGYLYAGAAAAARCAGDDVLFDHLRHLWRQVTQKQMYLTGQVGSSDYGEAFTTAYDLPNDTAYAETCAGLALAFFAAQMLRVERRGEYADVLERVLYNGAISGMDLTGTAFFYVNPLSVVPELTRKNQQLAHVKPVRQKWFGCACCPPNLARTLASLTDYALTRTEDAVYQHLYLAGQYACDFHGVPVTFTLTGNYPWSGELTFTVEPARPVTFTYGLRVPGWAAADLRGAQAGACGPALRLNGEAVSAQPEDGYLLLTREWRPGDTLTLSLPMLPHRVWAHPAVREDAGKVAVQRGPLVYCLEEADNGPDLHRILLPRNTPFTEEFRPDLLGGVMTLRCAALAEADPGDTLYTTQPPAPPTPKDLTFIPYYAWANRGEGEMTVWLRDAGPVQGG